MSKISNLRFCNSLYKIFSNRVSLINKKKSGVLFFHKEVIPKRNSIEFVFLVM